MPSDTTTAAAPRFERTLETAQGLRLSVRFDPRYRELGSDLWLSASGLTVAANLTAAEARALAQALSGMADAMDAAATDPHAPAQPRDGGGRAVSTTTPSPAEPRHTPGPWRVAQYCENPEWPAILPQRDGADVYMPLASVHDGKGLLKNQDEAWANARLIAAAPQMLAALEGILSAVSGGWLRAMPEHDPRVQAARAARAAATGEGA